MPAFLDQTAPRAERFPIPVESARSDTLAQLVATAAAAIESDVSAAKAYLERAAALLRVRSREPADASRQCMQAGRLAPWQARRIAAYIQANLASSIRVGDLSGIAGLSTSHFCHAFKATFGETPLAYITQERMRHAQQRMLSTRDSLAQIALECGMCDQSHFTRVFRRVVGMSPRAWRREFSTGQP